MLGFKRLVGVLALSSALVWLGGAAAQAAGNPDRQVLPPPPDLTFPFCGAATGDILAHVSIDREYIKTYTLSGNVIHYKVEGYQQDQFTVLATGKQLFVNASGPGDIWIYPDRVVQILQGHTLYGAPPDGGLFLYTGLVDVDTTTGTIAGNNGHVIDLCPSLR